MAVAGIASNEDPPHAVAPGNLDAQVPEADVVEVGGKGKARGLVEQSRKVVVLALRLTGHWSVEEPSFAHVNSAKELPVALQLRLENAIGRALREALFQT